MVMYKTKASRPAITSLVLGLVAGASLVFAAQAADIKIDEGSKIVEHSSTVFKPDPDDKETPYSTTMVRLKLVVLPPASILISI